MRTFVVTGAAGLVGRQVVLRLVADHDDVEVIALDRRALDLRHDRIAAHRVDLIADDLGHHLVGAERVIHLAADPTDEREVEAADLLLNRVLDGADAAGCRSLVVLSSATVYGAHADNPVPISEDRPARPNAEFGYAVAKLRVEETAARWADAVGADLCILRPATALSADGASWIAGAVRAAATVRPDQVDPPVQFLHHADLASAIVLAAAGRLDGVYNVAPDGWIGSQVFAELVGGVNVRIAPTMNDRIVEASRRLRSRRWPDGIEPYIAHPWVVANDRLRAHGWAPTFTNEEAYVVGTPTPRWALDAQRRQELALAAAGVGVAGVMGVAAGLTRRLMR